MNIIPNDLIGLKKGYLEVIEFSHRDDNSKQFWKCKCTNCGNEKIISRSNLLKANTRSCGCLKGIRYEKKQCNTYDLSGDYGIGYTTKGEPFFFDKEDYELIKNYNWYLNDNGYVCSSCPKKLYMHRLVMGVYGRSMQVDHIHHVTTDNRKSELRVVTGSQNQMNKMPRKGRICTGVSWHKKYQKWISQISVEGKLKFLGQFDNIDAAIAARKEAELKYYGEYAYKH